MLEFHKIFVLLFYYRPTQFYLVLDVVNLTAQEMLLNYTTNKNIVIEAKESCRVPVPVERCPLVKFLNENNSVQDTQGKYRLTIANPLLNRSNEGFFFQWTVCMAVLVIQIT